MPGSQPADPAADDFSIRIRTRGDILLIQLQGPLAGASVDIVRMYVISTLATHTPPKVVTDIDGVSLIDEAGLDILRSATCQARDAGGRMVITGGHRLLDPTGNGLDLASTIRDAFHDLDGFGEPPSS
ncbi:STAS domain-containing protein [Nonomuraea sp. KM90]|uniref:STAS domain-containing protein n=1 Tax=Nonomuraea sp. KM90 TaxID=3457428 RepID=UPI003FCE16E2